MKRGGGHILDDSKETVIDVVHSFRLNETQFDKKSYLGHLKSMRKPSKMSAAGWLMGMTAYMKKVKEAMKTKGASDDAVAEFEKGAQTFAKKVVGNFKDYEFLIGEHRLLVAH